jgi:S-DNA-T family DNA segregation ATPase FtsK/SpoIIIE
LILIVLSFSIFLRRKNGRIIIFFKKWLIHLLGGDLYNHVYDELSVKKHDVSPIIHQSTQIQKEANKIGQLTPPISFLTDTSIDSYYDNKNQAQKFEQTISKFLKKIEIDASCQNIVVMPQYVEIIFEIANVQGIDEILKNQNQLLTILKIDRFNISRKGNIVMFEIPNKTISKISIRQIFNTTKIEQNDKSIVGLTLENTPLQLDMKKNHNILIVGKRGSGAAMLLTVLLISYAYINPPTNVEYILLSLIGDKTLKSFDNLPHMLTPTLNNFEACINKLHQVMDEMKERENKFKDAGAKTLEDFNRFQSNPHSKLKKIILVISGFDNLLRNSLQNLEILHNILKQGPELGINTILLSINVNNELLEPKIYELIDVKFVLQLESEHESLKIFDNYRGLQLYGNGDGYCFEGENEKIRFQTCYLNINELTEIIRIIATFYKTKDQIN